jgi:hypothetical protein
MEGCEAVLMGSVPAGRWGWEEGQRGNRSMQQSTEEQKVGENL